jgi:hypothetical protein
MNINYENTVRTINSVCIIMNGQKFIELYEMDALNSYVQSVISSYPHKLITLIVYNLYSLVQLQSNSSLNSRKAATHLGGHRLKNISETNAVLNEIWFKHPEHIRFKIADSIEEAIHYLETVTLHLAKAPFKDTGSLLSVIKTGRTSSQKGADLTKININNINSHVNSDEVNNIEESGENTVINSDVSRVRLRGAKLGESYSNYLVQINGLSEAKAYCIIRMFPTFRRLFEAYSNCASDFEGEHLLENIECNGAKVGFALSRKVFLSIYTNNVISNRENNTNKRNKRKQNSKDITDNNAEITEADSDFI